MLSGPSGKLISANSKSMGWSCSRTTTRSRARLRLSRPPEHELSARPPPPEQRFLASSRRLPSTWQPWKYPLAGEVPEWQPCPIKILNLCFSGRRGGSVEARRRSFSNLGFEFRGNLQKARAFELLVPIPRPRGSLAGRLLRVG